MQKPIEVTTKVTNKSYLNEKIIELELEYIKPNKLAFIPGQYINVKVAENTYRSYSICSDYKNKKGLSIIVSAMHNGVGSSYIKEIQIGEELEFIGPSGKFGMSDTLENNIVFVATGTGVSTIIAFLYLLLHIKYKGNIRLLFGNRLEEELFYLDKLEFFKKNLKNFTYEVFISAPIKSSSYKLGRVTSVLKNYISENTQYYLCGNPNMIQDSVKILRDAKVIDENIYHEGFTRSES